VFRVVLHRMWERGWDFVQRAGTLILAVTILVWAAAYYPRDPSRLPPGLLTDRALLEGQIAQLRHSGDRRGRKPACRLQYRKAAMEASLEGAYLRESILGHMGRWIEPVVRPLGWDWKIGCAVIASLPARES